MGTLRFLLALSVVIGHAGPVLGITLLPARIAVEIFFALSGFYMALILSGKYARAKSFYVSRFLRLYPVYLIVMLATLAWVFVAWAYLGRQPATAGGPIYEQLAWWQRALIAVPNWTMVGLDMPSLFHYKAGEGFLLFHHWDAVTAPDGAIWAGSLRTVPQAWSIGSEVWFYLIAPIVAALASRWVVLLAIGSVAIRVTMSRFGFDAYYFFPAQLCFFLAGILLYRLYASVPFWRTSKCAAAFTWPLLFFLPVQLVIIAAIPFLFALTKDLKWDIHLGNLSYSIYMVHILVMVVVANATHAVTGTIAESGTIVAVFSTAAAALLYVLIERPVDAFRHRLRVG